MPLPALDGEAIFLVVRPTVECALMAVSLDAMSTSHGSEPCCDTLVNTHR